MCACVGHSHEISYRIRFDMTFRRISLPLAVAFVIALSSSAQTCSALRYREVLDHIEQRREELSSHKFFAFLADKSIAPERRLQFAPYWTFLAVSAPDIFDHWIWYENPRNALEERVNEYIKEDDFHYNFLFHDLETVLGYTLDRYGSYEAVVRHLWSHETYIFRQFFYQWAAIAVIYRDDPMVILTTFEAGEAGLTNFFKVIYESIYGDGGLTELKYFGKEHMDMEMSHNVTFWFGEEQSARIEEESLASTEITEEEKERYIRAADDMLDRFVTIYDVLYDLDVADDSIHPEKFKVKGYPPMRDFPARSTSGPTSSKEEL